MLERDRIRVRRSLGHKPPWTDDAILREYRFCNIRREDDAVTKWIAANWRTTFRNDTPRAIALARLVNWPPTLKIIGYPAPFDAKRIIAAIREAAVRNGKAWSSAYIVSTNGVLMDKAEYIVNQVVAEIPMWDKLASTTLAGFWSKLRQTRGMGSFIAAQIVADIKNTPGSPLADATDWWDWAAPGPGSLRGVYRFYEGKLPPTTFLEQLRYIRKVVYPLIEHEIQPLCLQDWQNAMCEADKYWRTQDGHGRPKAYYRPNPDFS